MQSVTEILDTLRLRYADSRFHLFDVRAEEQGEKVILSGRVLDEENRSALLSALAPRPVDDSGLRVLRVPEAHMLTVATNLTNLQGGPGWLNETLSQVLAGQRLEQLEDDGRWSYVRQEDGYLGWVYRPYMTAAAPLAATHLVVSPLALLLDQPDGKLLGRVLGGTRVILVEHREAWACVAVFAQDDPEQPEQIPAGWVPFTALRSLESLPQGEARRVQMVKDAAALVGVPYLWGGSSANGIDCSGFAQLLHRWAGLTLPRDADLQCDSGRPVDEPFQPGDLLFFGEQGEQRKVTHVGMSLGGWEIIHSSRRRNGVNYDNVQEVPGLRDTYLCTCSYL